MDSSLSLLSTKCFLSPVPQPKSEGIAGTGCTTVQMNIWICNHKNPVSVQWKAFDCVFICWISSHKEVRELPGKPCWWMWSDAPETLTMKSSLGCLLESKNFKSFELLQPNPYSKHVHFREQWTGEINCILSLN